ncbi:unnamed protein product [Calypogeia fissa]
MKPRRTGDGGPSSAGQHTAGQDKKGKGRTSFWQGLPLRRSSSKEPNRISAARYTGEGRGRCPAAPSARAGRQAGRQGSADCGGEGGAGPCRSIPLRRSSSAQQTRPVRFLRSAAVQYRSQAAGQGCRAQGLARPPGPTPRAVNLPHGLAAPCQAGWRTWMDGSARRATGRTVIPSYGTVLCGEPCVQYCSPDSGPSSLFLVFTYI